MAYFARINDANEVVQVIAISNDVCPDPAPDNEQMGIDYITNVLNLPGTWLQTSYNGNFRYNYAGPDSTYDHENDAFIGPQPYPSWVLNNQFKWVSPVPYPDNGGVYYWDEQTQTWQPME